MGVGLEVRKIMGDVGEDGRNGGIYLGMEEMEGFEVGGRVIMECKGRDNFAEVMGFEV